MMNTGEGKVEAVEAVSLGRLVDARNPSIYWAVSFDGSCNGRRAHHYWCVLGALYLARTTIRETQSTSTRRTILGGR